MTIYTVKGKFFQEKGYSDNNFFKDFKLLIMLYDSIAKATILETLHETHPDVGKIDPVLRIRNEQSIASDLKHMDVISERLIEFLESARKSNYNDFVTNQSFNTNAQVSLHIHNNLVRAIKYLKDEKEKEFSKSTAKEAEDKIIEIVDWFNEEASSSKRRSEKDIRVFISFNWPEET